MYCPLEKVDFHCYVSLPEGLIFLQKLQASGQLFARLKRISKGTYDGSHDLGVRGVASHSNGPTTYPRVQVGGNRARFLGARENLDSWEDIMENLRGPTLLGNAHLKQKKNRSLEIL